MTENPDAPNLNSISSNKILITISSFAAVTIWALLTGYVSLFGFIALHDDEGYLMITVKQFLEGRVLYNEIFTQYGPSYYLYKWVLYGVTGFSVTHDVNRLTALAVWTSTAFICGVFAYRLSRSTIAGSAVYVLTFLGLYRTIYEPEHPQSLCGFLVAFGLLLLTGKEQGRSFEIRLGLLGAALAFLFFAKINIGVFFGLAVAIVLALFFQTGKFRTITVWVLTTGAVLLPFVLFRKHFFIGWIYFCFAVAFSLLAALRSTGKDVRAIFLSKHLFISGAGFILTSFLIVLFIIAKGTTFDALLNGVILQNFKFGEAFYYSAPVHSYSAVLGLFGFAGAIVYRFFESKTSDQRLNFLVALAKIGFGVLIVAVSLFGGKDRRYHMLINFGIPFLWLLLIPPIRSFGHSLMPRVALVLTAILLTLQIYPIPGSQMSFGSFAMLIIAVLCLSDAAEFLKGISIFKEKNFLFSKAAAAFSILCILAVCFYTGITFYKTFQSQTPLDLPGAKRFRLPEQEVAMHQFLVKNLAASCDDFIVLPGKASYYFWAQKQPPTTFNTTAWMTLLNEQQQQAIVDKLQASARPCAVYYPRLAADGLRGQTLESFVLSGYILRNFHSIGEAFEHQLMIPRNSPGESVYFAKMSKFQTDTAVLNISVPNFRDISSIQIYDYLNKRVVANSSDGSILDAKGQNLDFPMQIENGQYFNFELRIKQNDFLQNDENLLLRLFDAKGQRIATIPFVK